MNTVAYDLIIRKTDTLAIDTVTGERIGSFDRTAGASRGTIRGSVVARSYGDWITALEAL